MNMPETETPSGPLCFSAQFPCDGRFCPAVAGLSVKVALSLGYPEAEAREFGQAIHRAFEEAVRQGVPGEFRCHGRPLVDRWTGGDGPRRDTPAGASLDAVHPLAGQGRRAWLLQTAFAFEVDGRDDTA